MKRQKMTGAGCFTLPPLGPLDTHSHTHIKHTQSNRFPYLVCLLVLFDQDGQVFLQRLDNVGGTLV